MHLVHEKGEMAVNNLGRSSEGEVGSADPVVLSHPTRQSGRPDRSFDEFYRREVRQILTLAQSLTGNWATAEDIAQEAFTVMAVNWTRTQQPSNPGTWARRIVVNKCLSWHRRRASESRGLRLWSAGRREVTEPTPDGFWDEVRALPRRQGVCIALRYLEDRSMADIAEILDCSEATVRVHLFNGRKALAAKLADRVPVDGA